MYERFTDRARKVMQLARRQATCRYAPALGSEHILLGLFDEGSGVAANAIRRLNVDGQKLWAAASACCELHPPPANSTEHLLLGMLHQPESCAAQLLVEQGLTLERVRREVLDLLGTV